MPRRPAPLLLLAIVAVFWPVLGGAYVYDDQQLVLRSPAVLHFDLPALLGAPLFGDDLPYWRPLTSLALALGHHLGGAAGIHALALLLHGANTLAVLGLARTATGSERTAFWAALLFAVHPVQVESLAWCAAINDPLWAMGALQAMRAIVRWRDRTARGAPWAAAAWCLFAMLAKENGAVAVLLALGAFACVPGDRPPRPSLRRALLSLSLALLSWWLLRALVFGELTAGFLRTPAQPLDALRLASAPPELLLRHLQLLAVPFPLTPFRSFDDHQGVGPALLVIALAVGLAAASALAPRRSGPVVRLAVLLVLAPLLPTLVGFRTAGAHPVGDRYLYLSAFGLALFVAHWSERPGRRWLLPLLAAVTAALAFVQTSVWRDQQHLVDHGLRWAPEEPRLYVMAGDLALARAQVQGRQALDEAKRAYGLAATFAERLGAGHAALPAAKLGTAWCLMLDPSELQARGVQALVDAFQAAVDADPSRPAAWTGLGVGNAVAQRTAAAERAFRRALELDPDHAEAWFNLGRLQAATGQGPAARASLQQALRCDPGNLQAQELLGRLR
ncbi:MAG: tetratricopeptide repeat protein [Planctomycetes bacterium]|nr:tetratricopeptide repeat protein [Planctomycetota bacterium]